MGNVEIEEDKLKSTKQYAVRCKQHIDMGNRGGALSELHMVIQRLSDWIIKASVNDREDTSGSL